MEPQPIWGLRARIVLALGVILAIFILLTEVSISQLVRVTMERRTDRVSDVTHQEKTGFQGENDFLNLRKLILFYMVFGAAIALLLCFISVSRLVVRPLSQITRAVEKVAGGNLHTEVPIRGSGELIRLGVAFNTMTSTLRDQRNELKNRLDALETSSADLRAAQEGLIRAAKLASVGTLAAGVAHEIGNPLAGVLGLLDALEQGGDRETEVKYRALMRREIRRIDKIISDLLMYARPKKSEDGKTNHIAFLHDVADHVHALLKAQKIFDNIDFVTEFPRNPIAVRISPGDLTQVFINLLLNAAQAMDGAGTITIQATEKSVPKGPENRQGTRIHITVQDSGPGITETLRDKVFEPFFSKREASEGAGLGLAICQSICEMAGGEIKYRKKEEQGACFEIILDTTSPLTS